MSTSPSTSSITPLLELTAPGMERVNALIKERMTSEIELISTLAEHLIMAGGKRIRPVLTLAGAMAADNKMGENAVRLAATVEFIHTATLLHDDVIDASDMRRGKKTAHKIWGNEASVLVGDFLFARAFELMVEAGNIKVLGRLARASRRITEGEIRQMLIAGKPDTGADDYLGVIIGKTAELFAASAETGAMIAGADDTLAKTMYDYGMALGIAFQITDDALDYGAEETSIGKTPGDDFAEGKITLPVMLAWRDGNDDEREFWMRCLGEGNIKNGDFETARKILARHDAITKAVAIAREHAEKAVSALTPLPRGDIRDALTRAARYTVSRDT